MAYTVTDIDKYLLGKKYGFYQMITKEWGAKDPDVIEIKKLWQAAQDANGTNTKIAKFAELQKKLQPMFDGWTKRINNMEAHLGKYNATQFSDLGDQHNYDFGKKFLEYSDMPSADKMSNLTIGEAFKEHYDFEQMKKLAADYGYDYRNKEERNEFLKNVGKIIRQQDLDKIWNGSDGWSIYTSLVTPVAKEYARKNFDKIDSDDYVGIGPFGIPTDPKMAAAVGADVVVNTLMAAAPAKAGANVWSAPVARAGANWKFNDRELSDAGKEAVSEAATNIATPFALRLPFRWTKRGADAVMQKVNKIGIEKNSQKVLNNIAKDKINETADKVYAIEKMLKNGAPVRTSKGNAVRYSADGKSVQRVSDLELHQINEANSISMEDFRFYLQNKNLLRNRQWGPKPTDNKSLLEKAELYDPEMAKILKKGTTLSTMKKVKENVGAGKNATDNIPAQDLATTAGVKLKETKFNWAKHKAQDAANSRLAEAGANYYINQLGRTKYGGTMITGISQTIPGVEKGIDLSVKEKPNVENDPELQMVQRMYELHKKYPNMVAKPKLPKKWENEYTIEEVFGQ